MKPTFPDRPPRRLPPERADAAPVPFGPASSALAPGAAVARRHGTFLARATSPCRPGAAAALAAVLLFAGPGGAAAPPCGDVNDNGKVTSSDALAVLRASVGQDVDLVCGPPAQPLATGEINDFGGVSDGVVRAGAAHQFVDNGDGTVSDLSTGLMWEKKDNAGGIHDKDNTYTWSTGGFAMNGTVLSTFLAQLNAGAGFAGHDDWRLPNRFELETLLNADTEGPATWAAFDASCTGSCSVTACSCTRPASTWTSTTYVSNPSGAWAVNFNDGDATVPLKSSAAYARAVRGGL